MNYRFKILNKQTVFFKKYIVKINRESYYYNEQRETRQLKSMNRKNYNF